MSVSEESDAHMRATSLKLTRNSGWPVAWIVFLPSMLGMLSGCVGMGNTPPVVTPPPLGTASPAHETAPRPAVPPKPRKSSPRQTRTEDKQHPEKTATIDPKSLLGLDPRAVENRLGAPARMENGTLSREWVYAVPGCSFSVFFYPTVNSTSFRVLKYGSSKNGSASTDSADACVRRILTARSNAGN